MQKVDMSTFFVLAAGGQNVRFMSFIDFCPMMLRFYEEKLVAQFGYVRSFDEFINQLL